MKSLETHIHEPKSGQAPTSLVILLHGYGANGRDLIDLAPHFAEALPDTVFVSPDAPFDCEMAPVGRQWFSLGDWSPEVMLSGVQGAAPVIDNFITEQADKYELPSDRVALLGFSQGTMLSLYAGPRYPEKLAGILGYSGALVWDDDTDEGDVAQIPVHLVHGAEDPVVPVEAYGHAKEHLEKAGFDVTGAIMPGLTHGVNEDCIVSGKEFLLRVLG